MKKNPVEIIKSLQNILEEPAIDLNEDEVKAIENAIEIVKEKI